jgi:hypothetical protein
MRDEAPRRDFVLIPTDRSYHNFLTNDGESGFPGLKKKKRSRLNSQRGTDQSARSLARSYAPYVERAIAVHAAIMSEICAHTR